MLLIAIILSLSSVMIGSLGKGKLSKWLAISLFALAVLLFGIQIYQDIS